MKISAGIPKALFIVKVKTNKTIQDLERYFILLTHQHLVLFMKLLVVRIHKVNHGVERKYADHTHSQILLILMPANNLSIH